MRIGTETFLVTLIAFGVSAVPADVQFPGQTEPTSEVVETTTLKPLNSNQVSNREKRRLYEEALERCTQNGDLMPFYNTTQQKYLCYKLLQQGPCGDKQWVALDVKLAKLGLYFARCFDKKCPTDLVEIKSGTCQTIYGDKDCPPGMHVLVNPFGKGKQKS